MATLDSSDLLAQFRRTLCQCQELYFSSGQLITTEYPDLLPHSAERFLQLMDDLHRALVVKIFVTICEADRHWSKNEKLLGESLLVHLWNKRLQGDQLKSALIEMSGHAMSLKWYSLVRPFDQISPLRNRVGDLETIAIRLANLIARSDGLLKPSESASVKMIQNELHLHLRRIPIDAPDQHEQANEARIKTIQQILHDTNNLSQSASNATQPQADAVQVATELQVAIGQDSTTTKTNPRSAAEQLEEALAELEGLVGLGNIKHEVRTLANFLKVQAERKKAKLPVTDLSLHMIFGGNPGTGKTTVARIVGRVFGAMGVLSKGHLVETDRSGLVAEFAGQTGPKTNKKIDEALDGVLFIDEAYTLISSEGDDPFGREAVQTLLKRMEDDRNRLVVILAGYPNEMQTLLQSNPGLSSRFSRNLDFEDYTALELSQIFGIMCDKNHYHLQTSTRAKVSLGFHHLYEMRDRHFGNGRNARNLFEHAIRRMANRIAEIAELSIQQLTILEPEDIEFRKLPEQVFEQLATDNQLRFHITCPECNLGKEVPEKYLGKRVRCPKCEHDFDANWGAFVREKT